RLERIAKRAWLEEAPGEAAIHAFNNAIAVGGEDGSVSKAIKSVETLAFSAQKIPGGASILCAIKAIRTGNPSLERISEKHIAHKLRIGVGKNLFLPGQAAIVRMQYCSSDTAHS